jgi:predicted nuclease of predicted toxin-antitoxin system
LILDSAEQLVVVTADSDFASMLALSGASRPSVVQLRGVAELPPATHLRLLDNLRAVTEDLDQGAVVSLSPVRLAVRRLPTV